jgi:hypothetical protein
MMRRRPHTATVAAVGETKSGDEITAFPFAGSTSILGQLTEDLTPGMIAENYGIDTKFPATWMCNVEDIASIVVGDRLTINSRIYYVHTGPRIMDAQLRTSHAVYVLERDV